MAAKEVHVAQARHNEELAAKLVDDPPFHDWGVTAAFYAAIHFVEAWLFDRPERHTETSIPTDDEGNAKHTAHVWREKLVEARLGQQAFSAFRKLHISSECARYLSLHRGPAGQEPEWLISPASVYISQQEARKLLQHLQTLKWSVLGPASRSN